MSAGNKFFLNILIRSSNIIVKLKLVSIRIDLDKLLN